MSKTTRNQIRTFQNPRTLMFLTLLFLLAGFVSFAQLKVNPNTLFTVKNVVSSKEEANIFDSSILGEDQLVLNGQNQFLETAKNTSIPTLRITDGDELQIRTEVQLRGDLVVESGVLKLEQPIHVKGNVILENDAKVHNDFFINYENRFVFENDFTGTTVFKLLQSTPLLAQVDKFSDNTVIIHRSLPAFGMHPNLKFQFKGMPFSPPPEAVLIT